MISISGSRGVKKPLTGTRKSPNPASIAAKNKSVTLFNINPSFQYYVYSCSGTYVKKVHKILLERWNKSKYQSIEEVGVDSQFEYGFI